MLTVKEGALWLNDNALNNPIMKKFTEDEFKEKLDEYLQKLPDQPKIDGLIPWGQDLEGKPSNSILFQVARGPAKRSPGV